MRHRQSILTICALIGASAAHGAAQAQAFALPGISSQTAKCLSCHKQTNPGIYQQWGASKHFRGNIGCFECHSADQGDADAFQHEGFTIAVLVTPKDCARCHTKEAEQFAASRHSRLDASWDRSTTSLRKSSKATRAC